MGCCSSLGCAAYEGEEGGAVLNLLAAADGEERRLLPCGGSQPMEEVAAAARPGLP